ncbi:very short patch repair endonuclease [Sphingomonas sp. DT-207]|uniref:very short patch repair endonuclease n=1 Tax=Sphingomonas sp. DT-207 TaxID=3396167 RepID=UPI003F1939EC
MRRIRSKDTKPELVVRRILYSAGYRYRLHGKGLPGKPDVVFSARRKVIFIHGCFWHQHEEAACLDGRKPKSNTAYWHSKLARNVDRDLLRVRQLEALGWEVLTVWDCETRDRDKLAKRLGSFLGAPRLMRH